MKIKNKWVLWLVIFTFFLAVFLISLKIFNNMNNLDNKQEQIVNYYLRLKGSSFVTLEWNEKYKETGYLAYDSQGNDLSNEVIIDNQIDYSKPGTYTINYYLKDIIQKREVTILEKQEEILADIKLSLNGEKEIYLLINTPYQEMGATAYDQDNNDQSFKIKISGNVDTSKEGTYQITYSIENQGIIKTITRNIIVYDVKYKLTKNCNSSCNITFEFIDNYFKCLTLPNNIVSFQSIITYEIKNNGTYKFIIYDIYNNKIIKEIQINEIDTIKPTASCYLYLNENNSYISVNASDSSGIKGYVYKYGNKTTNLLSSSTYTYTDYINEAKVIVYDNKDNQTTVNCQVIDKTLKYNRSFVYLNDKYSYWLYVPKKLSVRNKLPLVIFLHGRGECGDDGKGVLTYGFPKYISEGQDYDFVLIAPQLPSATCSSGYYGKNVMAIIEKVINTYPIDEERIIITGFSLGGSSTFNMLKQYPDFFAGAIPMAAITNYDDNLTKTPIWSFHGKNDTAVSYRDNQYVMQKIISVNPNSKFTLLENEGHTICNQVHKRNDVLNWIYQQRRIK